MANQIRLKRSAVQGKAPVVGDLELGELAVNTYDGKLYMKKNDGADAIIEFITSTVTGDFTVDTDTLYVDSTNNRVGIVESAPAVALDVSGEIRASTGILFGTDTAAANTLDDYEEGNWTPVFKGDTTAGTYTYTSQLGRYTKIGNTVTVHASLEEINTVSAGAGTILIGGLPFTSSTDLVFPQGVARLDNFDIPASTVDMNATMIQNTTDMIVVASRDSLSATGLLVTSKLSNTADVYLSCTYRAA